MNQNEQIIKIENGQIKDAFDLKDGMYKIKKVKKTRTLQH